MQYVLHFANLKIDLHYSMFIYSMLFLYYYYYSFIFLYQYTSSKEKCFFAMSSCRNTCKKHYCLVLYINNHNNPLPTSNGNVKINVSGWTSGVSFHLLCVWHLCILEDQESVLRVTPKLQNTWPDIPNWGQIAGLQQVLNALSLKSQKHCLF